MKPFEKKNLFLTYPRFKSFFAEEDIPREMLRMVQELLATCEAIGVECVKHIVAYEKHSEPAEEGKSDYHYHVYLQLDKAIKLRQPQLFDINGNHPNVQRVNFPSFCQKYCMKGGQYITNYTKEELKRPEPKEGSRKIICRRLMNGEDINEVIEDHPQILYDYQKYLNGLNLWRLTSQKQVPTDKVRGIWIYGQSGVGKSRGIRDLFNNLGHNLFIKPQNKWWDGYRGESVVLLDDLDTATLGHYLKIWLDHHACSGEIKGGTVPLLHKYFVITSNYTVESLFRDNESVIEPIRRRCQIVHQRFRGPISNLDLTNLDVVTEESQPPSPPHSPQLSLQE